MSMISSANVNQGDSDGSWEYAPDYSRSPPPPLPLPTLSNGSWDFDDPAVEINDMKNKLEHNSSLVHYWTQKCVGAEQKLTYLTRQVNKALQLIWFYIAIRALVGRQFVSRFSDIDIRFFETLLRHSDGFKILLLTHSDGFKIPLDILIFIATVANLCIKPTLLDSPKLILLQTMA
ncbi:unnamed protein product [Prunus brigantina]